MGNYLASVIIYNLLPKDYKDLIATIEGEVNSAISGLRKPGFDANDKNMFFSFPQDPSVDSKFIPVLADITFFSSKTHFKPGCADNDIVAETVRKFLLPHFDTIFNKRGEVLVTVRSPADNIGYAPRE